MARKKSFKVNAKGQNDLTDRFVRLPHKLLSSGAYRSLGVTARALLVELIMLDFGSNNGSLYLSLRDAADRLGFSDHHSVSAAFNELLDRGFVRCTKEAHFQIKTADQSRARCWCLTWIAAPSLKRPASNDWQTYVPPVGSKERKRAERGQKALKRYIRALTSHRLPVVDSTALRPLEDDLPKQPEVETTTDNPENDAIPPSVFEVVSTSHTAVTTTRRPQGEWWRARSYLRLPERGPLILANDK